MPDLLATLLPLAAASALVPVQIIITILLLRSASGKATAGAWVAGMTAARLLQGVVFGLILGPRGSASAGDDDSGLIVSTLLLVVAIIFYVVAAKQLMRQPDEDAPPPRWMTLVDGVGPGRAFLLGMGLIAVGAKFWVFTLGAMAAIGGAGLELADATVAFLLFIVVAESIHLAILALAYAAPARADAMLGRLSGFLEQKDRVIMIILGLAFGTWFLLGALDGFGIA